MLNHALRTQEVSTIIKMGFFIRDLHQNIKKLHSKRISDRRTASFVVYRGQGLSKIDFDKILKSKGGLMAFNNFLSTSIDRDISYIYADSSLENPESVGIVFVITINTSISSVPFANINDVSYFPSENEILFSMHTVFRIGEIQQIGGNHRLWQVNLTLTSDNDPQLAALTKRMQQEIKSGQPGWCRLGALLEKLGEFEKAEEVYQVLFNQITDDLLKPHLYQLLGNVKSSLGNYEQALLYFQRSLEIYQKIAPSDHHQLITTYNNMAAVYTYMGDYAKASSYYERVIEVRQRNLPPNHPSLAIALCNIGLVFFNKKEYSKALSYYKKAEAMYKKSLPSNHPQLSACYNNIAGVYEGTGEYTEALSYLEKVLDIDTKTLPPNHPDLASDYNNIGYVYVQMCEYSKAIPYLERSVEIGQCLLSPNHPNLKMYRRNLENAREELYKKC
jgi:tetratricopeptide (TPR) repeat protein